VLRIAISAFNAFIIMDAALWEILQTTLLVTLTLQADEDYKLVELL